MQRAWDSEATTQKRGSDGPTWILLHATQSPPAVLRWPGGSSNVDLVQGTRPSGRGAPKDTGRRLSLSMQTHTSLNECNHSRASAYFKSTSVPAHQLLHTQQLAAAKGPAPPCGSWQLEGVIQPSTFLLHYTCRLGKQKSDQLTGLRFQPEISASSTARRDFAKIHIRQLLRTLLFCLYHPEHAGWLAGCFPVCLSDPAFELVVLLFPGVARACSARTSLFLALLPAHPRDSLPQGVEVSSLRHSECPSVSPPSNSCGFQGAPPDVSQWSRVSNQAHKKPHGHEWLLTGPFSALGLQLGLQLNALVPPC